MEPGQPVGDSLFGTGGGSGDGGPEPQPDDAATSPTSSSSGDDDGSGLDLGSLLEYALENPDKLERLMNVIDPDRTPGTPAAGPSQNGATPAKGGRGAEVVDTTAEAKPTGDDLAPEWQEVLAELRAMDDDQLNQALALLLEQLPRERILGQVQELVYGQDPEKAEILLETLRAIRAQA